MPRPFLIGLGSMPFSPSLQLSGFHMLSHTILLKSCELYIIIINLQIKIEVQHKKRTCPWHQARKQQNQDPNASHLLLILEQFPQYHLLQNVFCYRLNFFLTVSLAIRSYIHLYSTAISSTCLSQLKPIRKCSLIFPNIKKKQPKGPCIKMKNNIQL